MEKEQYHEVFKKIGFLPMFETYEKMQKKSLQMEETFKNCFKFKTYDDKKHRKLWKKYYIKFKELKPYGQELEIQSYYLKRFANETPVHYNFVSNYTQFFKNVFVKYSEIYKEIEDFLNKEENNDKEKLNTQFSIFESIKNLFIKNKSKGR